MVMEWKQVKRCESATVIPTPLDKGGYILVDASVLNYQRGFIGVEGNLSG